ncbi:MULTISPECIES: hypothetical protein [unclassified Chryseobacterium]|uniref:hypothetical protein n=1 Tax=unclassified Chryseobacterium TaxID=2593645 RepID=UPI000F45C899|nr:hypothetical protein [Chryseobacterium sp. G0240]ROI02663.1 hypothetical protein EGI16_13660 [Chryseobacterium sp. G0240]
MFLFVSGYCQKIPIVGYFGIPEQNISVDNYRVMKDAGFSISLMNFSNLNNALNALDAAQKVGIKLILFFPQLHSEPQISIPKIKNHPALYGYFIGDEPFPSDFNNFVKYLDIIKTYDDTHKFYINLNPMYASKERFDGIGYEDYISQAINKLPFSFVSFDHYPLVDNKIRKEFYENLEIINRQSKKYHKSFWAFACSTIHFDYLKPELAGIKLQQFGNLLYGAQGLQYFTYWTMTSDPNWIKDNYSYSIVDDKGQPTPTYNIVKTVNEQVQRLAWVFSGARSDAVYHTGKNIPQGTQKLISIPEQFSLFSTKGKNALISCMSNNGKKFVIVQNKSLDEDMVLEYQLKKNIKKVNNTSGKLIELHNATKYKDLILPGDILIFAYNN